LHPDGNGETTGTASLPAAWKRAARGGRFLLFVFALLAASFASRPGTGVMPPASGQRVLTASSAPFVAVIPQLGFHDPGSGPRAVHEWRSRKPAQHITTTPGGAALIPPAAGLAEAGRDRPHSERLSGWPRRPAFRHFDARGPPAFG
jgi:hypothetical protein